MENHINYEKLSLTLLEMCPRGESETLLFWQHFRAASRATFNKFFLPCLRLSLVELNKESLRNSKTRHATRFMLECSTEQARELLRTTQDVEKSREYVGKYE